MSNPVDVRTKKVHYVEEKKLFSSNIVLQQMGVSLEDAMKEHKIIKRYCTEIEGANWVDRNGMVLIGFLYHEDFLLWAVELIAEIVSNVETHRSPNEGGK